MHRFFPVIPRNQLKKKPIALILIPILIFKNVLKVSAEKYLLKI